MARCISLSGLVFWAARAVEPNHTPDATHATASNAFIANLPRKQKLHRPFQGAIPDSGHRAAFIRPVIRLVISLCMCAALWGQSANRVAPDPAAANQSQGRLFWIIPNHRTHPADAPYHPLTTGEKFKIARQEVLDPGTFLMAGVI